MAIQEHLRLRNAISALRHYKADLLIAPPKCKGSHSCEAEPFSKWLEEDPAEAFLTFDQEPSTCLEEKPMANGDECRPKSKSATATSSAGKSMAAGKLYGLVRDKWLTDLYIISLPNASYYLSVKSPPIQHFIKSVSIWGTHRIIGAWSH